MISARVRRSFKEKPNGSNSTETLLSRVRERMEMRFLTSEGETIIFFRRSGEPGMDDCARWVTGSNAPLPTVIGGEKCRGWREERLPEKEAMWDEAPVSRYQSAVCGPNGGTPEVARAASMA
jgi:hypothetical protein